MYSEETEKKIVFTKQKYYVAGPTSLKLLARKLKKQRADSTMYKIKDLDSKTIKYKQEVWLKMYNVLLPMEMHKLSSMLWVWLEVLYPFFSYTNAEIFF